MNRKAGLLVALLCVGVPCTAPAAGDPARGAAAFAQCVSCHSTEAGEQLTGPSLAGIWGRKAGSLPDFHRYSEALRRSGVVWNEQSLDNWLRNPAAFVPGNAMPFPGIADATQRADVIAYLKSVSEGKAPKASGGTGMMMGAPRLADLKQAGADRTVKSVSHCGDTYTVLTSAGRTLKFWEYNLRFKTDSSKQGPHRGAPVLVPQGMGGDRAQLVFADPAEISATIKAQCP
jgi:cytochrome c